MPLDYALSILRDKNNDVKLSLPITGNIENPDFNINSIIFKTLGKALKMASVSILKNLFQPYGALITVVKLAKMGGDYITRIQLDPILFDAGSTNVNQQIKEYLEIVKKLMNEKIELRLTICGIATDADLLNSDKVKNNKDKLLPMAEERSKVIYEYLSEQGINAERLFLCNPEIDNEAEAKPRVLLYF
ncbi:MAG: hypothetical protein ABIA04_07945 [Pseudomonadota bacterium]